MELIIGLLVLGLIASIGYAWRKSAPRDVADALDTSLPLLKFEVTSSGSAESVAWSHTLRRGTDGVPMLRSSVMQTPARRVDATTADDVASGDAVVTETRCPEDALDTLKELLIKHGLWRSNPIEYEWRQLIPDAETRTWTLWADEDAPVQLYRGYTLPPGHADGLVAVRRYLQSLARSQETA